MGEGTEVRLVPPWETDQHAISAPAEPQLGEPDFFISYAGEDFEIARWIADELRRERHVVCFQQRNFGPGGKFHRQIDAALGQARRVIGVVSEASLKSAWCRDEWDAAGEKLLPLRIERTPVEGLQGLRSYVDLFGPGIDDEASRRGVLLEAVAGQQAARRQRTELGAGIELPRGRPALNGREPLLKEIFARLHGRDGATRRLTLTGMGGIGKSAIASEYGHRMRECAAYDHVWFVRAEQPAALEDQLRVLVNDFQVPRRDLPLSDQVQKVLQRQSRWLLIVDQAPDLGAIRDYLPPSGSGHVLITSENTATWGGANLIDVPGWSHDESVKFLLEETGSDDRAAAEALANELDHHPETLIQAASYIDRTGTTISTYLERYRDQRSQAAERGVASLALAIDHLQSKPLAVEMLRVAAFLAPDRIPVELLMQGLEATGNQIDERDFDLEVAEPLRRFSLVRRDDPHLSISRLVQRQVRASALERGDSDVWIAAALRALDDLFPSADELAHPDVWPRAAELLPHLLAATERALAMRLELALVGRLWCRAGAYLGIAEYGKSDRPVASNRPSTDRGAEVGALHLLTEARRLLDSEHPGGHLDVAEAAAELGLLWQGRGRLDKAIPLLTDAYDIAVRVAGADSLVAGLRLVQLARCERDAGAASEAVDKLERAMVAAEAAEAAGTDGRTLRYEALASLGIALTFQGHLADAVARLSESIRAQEEVWGPNHVEVAYTLDALGDALAAYGDDTAAADAYDRKLEIERAVYGEQSRHRSFGLNAAAAHAIDAGNVARGRELAIEILWLVGDDPVPNDPTLSVARQLVARADRLSDGSEWRELLADAGRALVEAGLPDVEPRLLLVDYLVEDGSPREGAELAALVAHDCIDGEFWSEAPRAILTEAVARTRAGELGAAKDVLVRLVELLEQHPDSGESLLILAQLALGQALLRLNLAGEALASFEAAHALAVGRGYMLHQADALMGSGESLAGQGKHEHAARAYRDALELRASSLAPGHAVVTEARLAVARAEGSSGNEAEARKHLNDAVAATAARVGAHSIEVARTYVDVADILVALGRKSEAKGRLDEALRILERIDGDARNVLAAKIAIGSVLLAVGERARARELATSVHEAADPDTTAGRVARAGAAELALRVAAAERDADRARRIVDDLERELRPDPTFLPPLRAYCWLLLSEIVEDDDGSEALAAVEHARTLDADPLYTTPGVLGLREAELNILLGRDEKGLRLAEELLLRAQDPPFRLDVLRTAAFAARNQDRLTELVREASALADGDDDPLRRAGHRMWIAAAQPEAEGEKESRRLYRLAADDLRAVDDRQPDRAREASELFSALAHEFSQIGEYGDATQALADALERYRRALDDDAGAERVDGGEAPLTSSFLIALMGASHVVEARQANVDRRLSDGLAEADPSQDQFLVALLDLVENLAFDDESFDRLARWADGLGERDPRGLEQIGVLATLAERRASAAGWDERAVALLAAAERKLGSAEEPLESLRARLALLRAKAYLDDDDPSAALATLESAADALGRGTDVKAAAQVVMTLAGLHADLDYPQAAARRFDEAKRLLDALRSPLADRLELRTALALAHLRAGNRLAGIGELRRAVGLVVDEEPGVDVETIRAMVHLASTLATEADDRARAGEVADAAVAVHDALLASNAPRFDATSELAALVRDVRGVDAALTLVGSAIERLDDPFYLVGALVDLAGADVTAEHMLDMISSSDDPVACAETARRLAQGLAFGSRTDDARTLLQSAIERLRAAEGLSPSLELDLLIELSELDEPGEDVRASLGQALEFAVDHAEVEPRVSEIQARLGLELAYDGAWEEAVELLSGIDVPEPYRDEVMDVLAVGTSPTESTEHDYAIDELSRLVARDPDNTRLLHDLAQAEFAAGRYQAALDSAGQALAVAGPAPPLLVLCARLCNEIAEYEAAAEYARAAITIEEFIAEAHRALAWALQHLGPSRGEECEAAFDRLLEFAEDGMTRLYALKGRAGARRVLGREAEARADYESVLSSLEPDEPSWLAGWVRYCLGDYDGAAVVLKRVLAADPDRIHGRFDLALVYAVAGDTGAIDEYRAALAVLDEREPRARLAPLRVAQNDLTDAQIAHARLKSDPAFRAIVEEVEAKLASTESLVVAPILPRIPLDAG